ncbi:MAG: FAD-binding oxidoreductase [Planctomycetes bacterium]|nr:FAD-binding oxidoreductase [Planctomycetota bacterium]
MANIVIAGAGAAGINIAYHLALRGAKNIIIAEPGTVACGSTGKAIGGVRQQFSTAHEVRMTQESIQFFEMLGKELFYQVGYLFFATTEAGMAELEARRRLQLPLGVPVERVDRARIRQLAPGLNTKDILGGLYCAKDGLADPPAVAREILARAVGLGVDVREHTDPLSIPAAKLVIALGSYSVQLAEKLNLTFPIRPLVRQLIETEAIADLPDRLPMIIDTETGFHFRRKRDRAVIAMGDPSPRWQYNESVDESIVPDRMLRFAERFPPGAGARVSRAWAGLYDMTPDAHPILGKINDNIYAACGFSGHGFMKSPAVGRALAEEILDGRSSIDIDPFRFERFANGAHFESDIIL